MPSSSFVVFARSVITLLLAVIAPISSWGFSQNEVLQLQKQVSEMNKTLPAMISNEMQLTRVQLQGENEFIYVTKTILYSADQINPKQLENTLKPNAVNGICTTPDMVAMVKRGMKYTYVFYDKFNKYISQYSISSRDCGF